MQEMLKKVEDMQDYIRNTQRSDNNIKNIDDELL